MIQKYYDEYKIRDIDRKIVYILIAMLAIIPIITSRYTRLTYSPVFLDNLYGTGYHTDLFNFYKTIFIYIGTFAILTLFIYRVVKLKVEIKRSYINIVLIILVGAIIASTILANYTDIALFGSNDRHEGALSWLCQITIFFVIYNITIEQKYYKYFYFALYPFLIINSIIGILSNVYGKSILEYKFVQFILGGEGNLQGYIDTTLYNRNFGSGIAALIFCIGLIYLLLEKNNKKKILILIGVVLSFTNLLVCMSNSGFITMLTLLPIILIISLRFAKKKDIAIWSIIVLCINYVIYQFLSSKNEGIYVESFGLIEKINSISSFIIPVILAVFCLVLFIMKYIDKKIFFIVVTSITLICIVLSVGFYGYALNKQENVLKENANASIVRIQDTEIFKKLDSLSSGRIFIWTKTIGLIKDKPLLGYGLDTFPYEFIPNDEDRGEISEDIVIDKPHNWYLSIAYGTGLIGLAGVLGILICIIKEAFYKCVDRINNKYIYIFTIGIIAYAIQGLFNDSYPGTLLIFWMMAGLSLNSLEEKTKRS